ncbi:TadE/TadG family type IV pilus assembly protein [Roseovarius sp. BRH_c41]|jgi:Flp pilus assembly protein TadG|uniref:TadE/TadG family type IV pilus assembly protein n=1 Tax=Roseovarius sp. BRH_c41 TaxID=1629709 RepID=UPI000B0D31E1|nr:TadE/TadG family type IV pilus assembly protein [Roseovarius sp. BRH_c41]
MRIEGSTIKEMTPRVENATTGLVERTEMFIQEEDGTVTVLSFFIFVMFLMMGGIGLDTMRQEMARASLQATLDRAVLAGATASTEAGARTIVEDYFAKSGQSDYLLAQKDGDISTTLNAAKVTAGAELSLDTYLMKLAGVPTLSASGTATAEVRIPKLEAILVLDVSGSMASNSKIQNLQTAAKDFVTTVMNSSKPGDTVMSIVPFSFSVTPPQSVFDALAVEETHNYSTCLEFKENDYQHATLSSGSSSLSSGIPVNQMVYTSVYGDFDNLDSGWRSCYTDEYIRILPYSTSITDLHAKIDALQPAGNTSGNEGMNWGAALLDPTFREVTASMIAAGHLSETLANVPSDYDEPETLKAIIFMGDGANTTSYFFDRSSPKYRGKFSDLYEVRFQERVFKYAYNIYNVDWKKYGDDGKSRCSQNRWECVYDVAENSPEYSVYYLRNPDTGKFWSVAEEKWIEANTFNNFESTMDGFISRTQLDWEMAWGLMSPEYYGQTTGNWGPWNDYIGSEYVSGSMKNGLMQNVCKATKTEGVVVYSIGFEVPVNGTAENQLSACASSPAHYFRASGTDIKSAFSAIAANVKQLRLTQ